ncbi:MAG: FkbM family methyltransferase [Candidatus Nitrosoglobus sp.]
MITKIHKLFGILSVSDKIWLMALRLGVVASVEHISVLRHLGCHTVVDIGANRGQFALVARYCFPQAQIIAFEPLTKPVDKFRRVFAGVGQVTLHQVAIGPGQGQVTIHISARDDSSSLLSITALQGKVFPGTAEIATEVVKIAPLSDFLAVEDIQSPALLKLDVQGYELETLKGCEALLHCFTYVYCECSFMELYAGQALADEVIAWLLERGFRLKGVYNMAYDQMGKAVQGDFLFWR